ncbi:MAG: carbonic anhydrase [Elusimicrobia bacterium]|nr:carbonic anhydrase [Elusimicrobiota bacterium]
MRSSKDLPETLKNTPFEVLLRSQNMEEMFEKFERAQILIGMCMDNRKQFRLPENFAYILRTGGGSLRHSEFKVSYAIGVGGVRHIALIAHNHCGMVHVADRREAFVAGLVENAGWDRAKAEEHFIQLAPLFEIGNEVDFVLSEAKRIRERYPKVMVVPFYYKVEDNQLYVIDEKKA